MQMNPSIVVEQLEVRDKLLAAHFAALKAILKRAEAAQRSRPSQQAQHLDAIIQLTHAALGEAQKGEAAKVEEST